MPPLDVDILTAIAARVVKSDKPVLTTTSSSRTMSKSKLAS